MSDKRLNLARAVALIVPAALLGGAVAFEKFGGLTACEMCWWQRYGHIAAIGFAVLAFLAPNGAARRALVALAGLGLAASALIGAYHAGVEYQWWKGFTACTSEVNFAGQNPLDAIMSAPILRCDVVQWKLFGISLAGYNFLISGVAAALVLALLARRKEA
ncbi:disulfide bond formation protein B [Novosphingobium sp. FSY-8]|uniref:Putative protein-disulfide oxidoreductase DsbI n=1 Tax=Novosphingobium ovatum TaxID=1908523 RepID=A0ABW9XHA5_9SPHN|nr:disulfide bond formation protein B [Novosphingobium ovatum]NBC37933.1 disulfide bond formation protein B [Novosphingobium ovatum]